MPRQIWKLRTKALQNWLSFHLNLMFIHCVARKPLEPAQLLGHVTTTTRIHTIPGAKGSPVNGPSFGVFYTESSCILNSLNDSWMFDKYLCLRGSGSRWSNVGGVWCHAMCVHYPDCAKTFEVWGNTSVSLLSSQESSSPTTITRTWLNLASSKVKLKAENFVRLHVTFHDAFRRLRASSQQPARLRRGWWLS